MNTIDDIKSKRYLLSSIRMRFAPEVQQARESIIDSIVENVLFAVAVDKTVTAEEIEHGLDKSLGVHILHGDVISSLQRLISMKRVESTPETLAGVKLKGKKKALYRLSTEARDKLKELERDTTRRFNSACERLFRDAQEGWASYAELFLEFLSLVFSQLAEENVRMIRGDMSADQLISSPAFTSALGSIKHKLGALSFSLLEHAAVSFFSDPDPDYAAIKWNMAQNYYVLKVIGLDNQSRLLSADLLANVVLYLDTNVVISALEPRESHHRAFVALCNACGRLGAKVRVCKITLEELDRVINANRDMLQKVVNQIPEETAVKVASDFFEAYLEKKKSGEEPNIDAVFTNFASAEDKLRDLFKVETEEDSWFEQAQYDARTSEFADVIATRYSKMRTRRKNDLAAKHDAICLLWMQELRQRNGATTWFLTRDYTLPGCVPPDCGFKSLAITIDALIQWLSPLVIKEDEEKDIAVAYSEMVRSRVLPQERIFNLEDFLIFHELDMECRELPAEDVEGCIRYIKQNVPLLNPTDPADREKLARAIAIYFTSPGRKYKQNIERNEVELSKLKTQLNKETAKSLKSDAWLRVSHIIILFLILEIIVVVITGVYGVGENAFQRVVNSWPFVVVPVPICIAVGWFYLGKKRLTALGWPMTKFFKHE